MRHISRLGRRSRGGGFRLLYVSKFVLPVGVDVIDAVLAKDIDSLEPRLTRHGYNVKALAELLNAKPGEIRSFLRGRLPPGRTQEFQSEIQAAGIPL